MKKSEILPYWPSLLQQMRACLNLSQESLADLLETNQATISRWEKGLVAPSYDKQKKIEKIASESNITSLGGIVELVRNSPSRMLVVDEDNFVIASSPTSEWIENTTVPDQLSSSATHHYKIVTQVLQDSGFWKGSGGLVLNYDYNDGNRIWRSVITSVVVRSRVYAVIQQTIA